MDIFIHEYQIIWILCGYKQGYIEIQTGICGSTGICRDTNRNMWIQTGIYRDTNRNMWIQTGIYRDTNRNM